MFNSEDIRKASDIFSWLLNNGELTNKNNKELYEEYIDENVQKILDIMASSHNATISKLESYIYLIPNTDNTSLGYTRQELKKALIGRAEVKNEEFYLATYMILVLLNEFYNGQGAYLKTRMSIDFSEFESIITTRLTKYENKVYEEIEEETKVPLSIIANYWKGLLLEDVNKATRTKYWYINRVVEFLQKEKLINLLNKTEIYPTNKMDMIVTYKMLNPDKLEEINNIINFENFDDERKEINNENK